MMFVWTLFFLLASPLSVSAKVGTGFNPKEKAAAGLNELLLSSDAAPESGTAEAEASDAGTDPTAASWPSRGRTNRAGRNLSSNSRSRRRSSRSGKGSGFDFDTSSSIDEDEVCDALEEAQEDATDALEELDNSGYGSDVEDFLGDNAIDENFLANQILNQVEACFSTGLPTTGDTGEDLLIGLADLFGKLEFAIDELLSTIDNDDLEDDFEDAIEQVNVVQQIQQFANEQELEECATETSGG